MGDYMKKNIIIVFMTLMLLTILYYMEYSIPNNTSSIENHLAKYMEGENAKILDMTKIDNIYPVLFKFNKNTLAEALLKKGINGRFKIVGTHYGEEGKISFSGFSTDKAQYQVIIGKNPGNIIKVTFTDGVNTILQNTKPLLIIIYSIYLKQRLILIMQI